MSLSNPGAPGASDDGEDVVGHGGREPWSPRRWAALALVLALLAGAGWLVDRDRRQGEEAALAECRAGGTRALAAAAEDVGTQADYARPSLAFLTSQRSLDALLAPVGRAAAAARPGVSAAAEACVRVEVWSVHADLRDRRAAYADHLGAEADRLGLVASEPRRWFDYPPALRDAREELFE